jgi:sigma-B regulation protein RsbU (phosphoserine phosphatase)
MKTSMEVGGDYYDYFKNDKDLFIVCGDATGHGLNAGMMVSITKAGLYGLELNEPEKSLMKLNQAIKAIDLGKMRMSLNIAKFKGSKVSFSSAGMPPAYFFENQKNETKEILIPGLPLGSVKNADYDLFNFEMNQGDVLVLISDGLPECDNASGEMLDYKAVKNCIHENGKKSSKDILDKLIELGDNWMNGKMNEDDITIVVIKKI